MDHHSLFVCLFILFATPTTQIRATFFTTCSCMRLCYGKLVNVSDQVIHDIHRHGYLCTYKNREKRNKNSIKIICWYANSITAHHHPHATGHATASVDDRGAIVER